MHASRGRQKESVTNIKSQNKASGAEQRNKKTTMYTVSGYFTSNQILLFCFSKQQRQHEHNTIII